MSAFDSLAAAANASVLSVFGQTVTYQQGAAEAFTVTAIPAPPAELEDPNPAYRRLWVRLSDFAQTPAPGDYMTLGDVLHDVLRVQPDGAGGAYLTINQTSRDPNA